MISQKAKYALRALVALAQAPRGEPVLTQRVTLLVVRRGDARA